MMRPPYAIGTVAYLIRLADQHPSPGLDHYVNRLCVVIEHGNAGCIAHPRHPWQAVCGYRQCHFFAGVGVWSYALRRAGWGDEREVWTGSCPCQPFSNAGRGDAYADERHLWPHWYRLIGQCKPASIFGEQVDAAIRTGWLDDVCLSLESIGYAVGAVSFPACSVGAPHIRQRVYFVADAGLHERSRRLDLAKGQQLGPGDAWREPASCGDAIAVADAVRDATREHAGKLRCDESQHVVGPATGDHGSRHSGATIAVADTEHAERRPLSGPIEDECDGRYAGRAQAHGIAGACSEVRAMADDDSRGCEELGAPRLHDHRQSGLNVARRGEDGDVVDAKFARLEGFARHGDDGHGPGRLGADPVGSTATAGAVNGFWADAEWIACRDGKARPTEPGTFPLVTGTTARVGRLRAYGNAICAPQAAEFVSAYLECRP